MSPEQEARTRQAMIDAGYGPGFSLNLSLERLPDYATDPTVATILAASN